MALRAAVLAALIALFAPAAAGAATKVGSTLPAWTGDTLECVDPGGCTFVPRTISGRSIAVPFDGVIVSWSARMPTSADTTAISVEPLRLTAIGAIPDGGSTTLVPPATDGAIVTRATRQGVSKGDLLAVDLDDGDEVGLAVHPLLDSLSWSFVPLLTGDRAPDSVDSDDFEALFNATIEPDADHDSYGDESQDKCPQLTVEHARTCKGKPQVSVSAGAVGIGVVALGKRIPVHATATAGDEMVAGARLEITLPNALKPGPLSGSAFCSSSGQRVSCPLGNLGPRQGYSVTIDALAVRPSVGEIQASGTTLFGGAPATAKAALRVTTEKRCGLTIRATDSSERGTTGGDRMVGTTNDDQLVARAGDDCLSGGLGGDLLAGGDGDDRADGGPGADLVRGDSGDDRLIGGPGRDRLQGGPGADRVNARDGSRDVVRCGPGRDRARVDAIDSVAGCELVIGRR
jgi:Ca2+-binding RTX toxin-like protein